MAYQWVRKNYPDVDLSEWQPGHVPGGPEMAYGPLGTVPGRSEPAVEKLGERLAGSASTETTLERLTPPQIRERADVSSSGHVFISYVHEDSPEVDRLQQAFEAAHIRVWRDTSDLWPGQDWRAEIRRAITDGALVFLACFSRSSQARAQSYQNEELLLAVEQMRLRRPGEPWLVPVRFDDCQIPNIDLGGGRSLASIQRADVLADSFDEGTAKLTAAILRILRRESR